MKVFLIDFLNCRIPIQHRKIAKTLQNDFIEIAILHGGCETLLNHCCKISTMLRCPLFIQQQNVPAIIAM